MSNEEKRELEKIHKRVRAAFQALSPEEKIQRLKDLGIFDHTGRLSSRYGGAGEFTGQEQPQTH